MADDLILILLDRQYKELIPGSYSKRIKMLFYKLNQQKIFAQT